MAHFALIIAFFFLQQLYLQYMFILLRYKVVLIELLFELDSQLKSERDSPFSSVSLRYFRWKCPPQWFLYRDVKTVSLIDKLRRVPTTFDLVPLTAEVNTFFLVTIFPFAVSHWKLVLERNVSLFHAGCKTLQLKWCCAEYFTSIKFPNPAEEKTNHVFIMASANLHQNGLNRSCSLWALAKAAAKTGSLKYRCRLQESHTDLACIPSFDLVVGEQSVTASWGEFTTVLRTCCANTQKLLFSHFILWEYWFCGRERFV